MKEQLKIIWGVGDHLDKNAIIDNHSCSALRGYVNNKIPVIIQIKLGTWHMVDQKHNILFPEIHYCAYCGKRPKSRSKVKRKEK